MAITVTSAPEAPKAVAASDLSNDQAAEAKPAPEEKSSETTEESETSEDQQGQEDGAEDTESQDQSEDKNEKKEGEQKPKKLGGFKKKIDRLEKSVSEKDREIEFLRKERDLARAGKNPEQDQVSEVKAKTQEAKPKADDFDSHEAYLDARDDWNRKQWDAEKKIEQQNSKLKTDFQKASDAHLSRVAEFKKAQTDYDDVLTDFIEDHGDPMFSAAMVECIHNSDLGPAVIYELAKNPEEFERINSLPAIAAAREFGKIELRLSKTSEAEPTKPKTTKAPPPAKPVTNKGGSLKKSIHDPGLSQAEYEQLRMEQMKKRA